MWLRCVVVGDTQGANSVDDQRGLIVTEVQGASHRGEKFWLILRETTNRGDSPLAIETGKRGASRCFERDDDALHAISAQALAQTLRQEAMCADRGRGRKVPVSR